MTEETRSGALRGMDPPSPDVHNGAALEGLTRGMGPRTTDE